MKISCFKAYDVRGRLPDELNEEIAYLIGRGYAEFVKPKRVVVGRDIRLSSAQLRDALVRGLTDSGVDVYDIGLCGTEGVYFATFHERMDGGIMVTASHNPPDYNGMKFVRERAKPISADTGLVEIRAFAETGEFSAPARPGKQQELETGGAYLENLGTYNPTREPAEIKLKMDRVRYWIGQGAQPTETVGRLIKASGKQAVAAEPTA